MEVGVGWLVKTYVQSTEGKGINVIISWSQRVLFCFLLNSSSFDQSENMSPFYNCEFCYIKSIGNIHEMAKVGPLKFYSYGKGI